MLRVWGRRLGIAYMSDPRHPLPMQHSISKPKAFCWGPPPKRVGQHDVRRLHSGIGVVLHRQRAATDRSFRLWFNFGLRFVEFS